MPDAATDTQPVNQTPPSVDTAPAGNPLPADIQNTPTPQPPPPPTPTPAAAPPAIPPPPQTFREGMESANPSYTTDENGNVVSTAPVRTASTKGVLGQILMGALQGAQRGMAAETPQGARGRGAAFSAGARAAEQGRIEADNRARAIAQQNFENRRAVTLQKLEVNKILAETAHITQVMNFEKEQEPGILRARQLENQAAELQIEGANTRLLTDAATAIDTLAKLDIPFQYYTEHNASLNAQIPALTGGDAFALQNGKRGKENGVVVVPKSPLQAPLTEPVTYNTYDGARDKDGVPIPTEHVLQPDGKATTLDWLNDYYTGRRQLYQMQQKTQLDMTQAQMRDAAAKAKLESAQADLAEQEAKNMRDMGINLPPNFKKPTGFTMPLDQLKQNLASQGVQIPNDLDQLYAIAHYTGDLNDYPERVTKGTGQKSRAQAVEQIRALGLNPNFDEKTYPAIRKQVQEYASTHLGTAGGNIIAYNTAVAHLDRLYDAAHALQTHDIRLWNRIAQFYGLQTGAAPKVVFDTIQNAITGEIGKTYEGGKPDVDTINRLNQSFASYASRNQMDAYAKTTAQLMQSKNNQLAQQYVDWTGTLNPNAINPESVAVYKKMGLDPYQGLPKALAPIGATGNQNPTQREAASFPFVRFKSGGKTYNLDAQGRFTANGSIWQVSQDGKGATLVGPVK